MPRPIDDFRIQFRSIVERSITRTDGDPRKFRRYHDFDDFMESTAVPCCTPRDLAIAFMTRYFGVYLHSGLRLALYHGVVAFLSVRSGRKLLSDEDVRALEELSQIEYQTELELTRWIDAHFRSIR